MSDEERLKVVTPEQLERGWLEKHGDVVYQRKFVVVAKLSDGNYVVRIPAIRAESA